MARVKKDTFIDVHSIKVYVVYMSSHIDSFTSMYVVFRYQALFRIVSAIQLKTYNVFDPHHSLADPSFREKHRFPSRCLSFPNAPISSPRMWGSRCRVRGVEIGDNIGIECRNASPVLNLIGLMPSFPFFSPSFYVT